MGRLDSVSGSSKPPVNRDVDGWMAWSRSRLSRWEREADGRGFAVAAVVLSSFVAALRRVSGGAARSISRSSRVWAAAGAASWAARLARRRSRRSILVSIDVTTGDSAASRTCATVTPRSCAISMRRIEGSVRAERSSLRSMLCGSGGDEDDDDGCVAVLMV